MNRRNLQEKRRATERKKDRPRERKKDRKKERKNERKKERKIESVLRQDSDKGGNWLQVHYTKHYRDSN